MNDNTCKTNRKRKGLDFDATIAVRDAQLHSTQKVLLYALASRANPNTHTCYPSQALLEFDTGLSRKTIQRKSVELEKMGLISRSVREQSGFRKLYQYRLNVTAIQKQKKSPCDSQSQPHATSGPMLGDNLSTNCDTESHKETIEGTSEEANIKIEVDYAGPSGPPDNMTLFLSGEQIDNQEYREEIIEKCAAAEKLVDAYQYQCVGAIKPRIKFYFELGRLFFPNVKCFQPGNTLDDFAVTNLNKLFVEFGHLTCFVLVVAFREWKYPYSVWSLPRVNPTPTGIFEQRFDFLAIWATDFDAALEKYPDVAPDKPEFFWSIAQQLWDRSIEAEFGEGDDDPGFSVDAIESISVQDMLHHVAACPPTL